MMNTAHYIKLHKLDEPHILVMVADREGLPVTLPANDATYYLLPFNALFGEFGDCTSEEMEVKIASQSKVMHPYTHLHKVIEAGVVSGCLSPGMLLRFIPEGKHSGELAIGEVSPDWQEAFNRTAMTYMIHRHQMYAQEMDEVGVQTGNLGFDRIALNGKNPREQK
jgi:hypothetical protein